MEQKLKYKIELLSRITIANGATKNEQEIAQRKITELQKQLPQTPQAPNNVRFTVHYGMAKPFYSKPTEVKVHSPFHARDEWQYDVEEDPSYPPGWNSDLEQKFRDLVNDFSQTIQKSNDAQARKRAKCR